MHDNASHIVFYFYAAIIVSGAIIMFQFALLSFYKRKKDPKMENKSIVLKIKQLAQNGNG